MHRGAAVWLVAIAALAAASTAAQTPAGRTLDIRQAVDLYSRGSFDDAIGGVKESGVTVSRLGSELDAWIASAPRGAAHRGFTAAAFAIELVWDATRMPKYDFHDAADPTAVLNVNQYKWGEVPIENFNSPMPVVAWACGHMPLDGATEPGERAWWLASIGVIEDGLAWKSLIGGERQPKASAVLPFPPMAREMADGHLAHARRRLGDDPQLRLADALARTQHRVLQHRDFVWIKAEHLLRDEPVYHPDALALAFKLLTPLASEASVGAEVELRLGRLELRRHRWKDAIARLTSARETTNEPFIAATADYLAGWAYEQLEQPAGAIDAYRRAYTIAPHVPALAFRLGAQLYLANAREEAYALIDRASRTATDPDLLSRLERGASWKMTGFIADMRKAVR
jgi:hypothetical protein